MINMTLNGQMMNIIYNSTKLLTFLIIIVYISTGHQLTAQKALKVIYWNQALFRMIISLNFVAQFGTNMCISLRRIHVCCIYCIFTLLIMSLCVLILDQSDTIYGKTFGV